MYWSLKKVKKAIALFSVPYYAKALFFGIAGEIEHVKTLRSIGKNFNTIIDIGANKGQFVLVARKCFPEAMIYSFEPLAEPARSFRKVFADDTLTTLHEMAIGPTEGEQIIHISKSNDSSSLLPISDLQSRIFPGTEEVATRSITITPLENVISEEKIESPALLKIDVQGYELEVLKGCKSLLNQFDYVYVECSFVELYEGQALADEVIQYLINYSFKLMGIYNTFYDKKGLAIQGDFLFINDSIR